MVQLRDDLAGNNLTDNSNSNDFMLIGTTIALLCCMIITTLNVKFRWFKENLNFQQQQQSASIRRRSSLQEDVRSAQIIRATFRPSTDFDRFVELTPPKTLPAVRITNASEKLVIKKPRAPAIPSASNQTNDHGNEIKDIDPKFDAIGGSSSFGNYKNKNDEFGAPIAAINLKCTGKTLIDKDISSSSSSVHLSNRDHQLRKKSITENKMSPSKKQSVVNVSEEISKVGSPKLHKMKGKSPSPVLTSTTAIATKQKTKISSPSPSPKKAIPIPPPQPPPQPPPPPPPLEQPPSPPLPPMTKPIKSKADLKNVNKKLTKSELKKEQKLKQNNFLYQVKTPSSSSGDPAANLPQLQSSQSMPELRVQEIAADYFSSNTNRIQTSSPQSPPSPPSPPPPPPAPPEKKGFFSFLTSSSNKQKKEKPITSTIVHDDNKESISLNSSSTPKKYKKIKVLKEPKASKNKITDNGKSSKMNYKNKSGGVGGLENTRPSIAIYADKKRLAAKKLMDANENASAVSAVPPTANQKSKLDKKKNPSGSSSPISSTDSKRDKNSPKVKKDKSSVKLNDDRKNSHINLSTMPTMPNEENGKLNYSSSTTSPTTTTTTSKHSKRNKMQKIITESTPKTGEAAAQKTNPEDTYLIIKKPIAQINENSNDKFNNYDHLNFTKQNNDTDTWDLVAKHRKHTDAIPKVQPIKTINQQQQQQQQLGNKQNNSDGNFSAHTNKTNLYLIQQRQLEKLNKPKTLREMRKNHLEEIEANNNNKNRQRIIDNRGSSPTQPENAFSLRNDNSKTNGNHSETDTEA